VELDLEISSGEFQDFPVSPSLKFLDRFLGRVLGTRFPIAISLDYLSSKIHSRSERVSSLVLELKQMPPDEEIRFYFRDYSAGRSRLIAISTSPMSNARLTRAAEAEAIGASMDVFFTVYALVVQIAIVALVRYLGPWVAGPRVSGTILTTSPPWPIADLLPRIEMQLHVILTTGAFYLDSFAQETLVVLGTIILVGQMDRRAVCGWFLVK